MANIISRTPFAGVNPAPHGGLGHRGATRLRPHVRPDQVTKFNLTPKNVTAVLVGLKSRSRVFAAQREINADQQEALMGVMPGVALDQLWTLLRSGENALRVLSCRECRPRRPA